MTNYIKLSFLIFVFLCSQVSPACQTLKELKARKTKSTLNHYLETFPEITGDDSNYLGRNEFSRFYKMPEDARVTLQMIPNINPQSQIPLKLKALLQNSEKQSTTPIRFAPKVFESICIYDVNGMGQKSGTYTLYLLRESFHGDMSFVFETDPIFFKYMQKLETRLEFYIKIFEAYQQLKVNYLKHCDIRPENIYYKQTEMDNFIPVFANFNQITSSKSYCPDGELAYMSFDEHQLDINFPTDKQKKKSEMFSLALTILQIEANFIQNYYQKYMRHSFLKLMKQGIDISEEEAMKPLLIIGTKSPNSYRQYFGNKSTPDNIKFDLDNIFAQILNRVEVFNHKKNASYSYEQLAKDATYICTITQKVANIEIELRKLGKFYINQVQYFKSDLLMIQYVHFMYQLLQNLKPNDRFYGRPDIAENLTSFHSIYRDIVTILTKNKSASEAILKKDLKLFETFILN